MIHYRQGNYDEAVRKYNLSLEKFNELGNKSGIAIALLSIGIIDVEKEEYYSALKNYLNSYSIFKQLNSPKKEIVVGYLSKLRDKIGKEEFYVYLRLLKDDF